jgi:hypothetical protein
VETVCEASDDPRQSRASLHRRYFELKPGRTISERQAALFEGKTSLKEEAQGSNSTLTAIAQILNQATP